MPRVSLPLRPTYPGGEIGRRAVFRRLCLRACWFESSSGYNNLTLRVGFFCARDWATIHVKGPVRPRAARIFVLWFKENISIPSTRPKALEKHHGLPVVIAGPCSAESRDQVLRAAQELAHQPGVTFLRAGLWKPRTRPNSFEGRGTEALPWLMEAQRTTGLQAITEVATPEHVEAVLKAGMTAMWIGARTTVSPFAVQALADALKGVNVTLLVKNPMHADLKLWLGAIERMRASVTGEVGALHRGFSSYGRHDFRNAPCGRCPSR